MIDPPRESARLLVNQMNLIDRKKIPFRKSGYLDTMPQIVGGLLFGQGGYMDFFDHRIRRKPSGNIRQSSSYLWFCKQNNGLKFVGTAAAAGNARLYQNLKLALIQLMRIVNDDRSRSFFSSEKYQSIVQILTLCHFYIAFWLQANTAHLPRFPTIVNQAIHQGRFAASPFADNDDDRTAAADQPMQYGQALRCKR